jgi:hypothetical protein
VEQAQTPVLFDAIELTIRTFEARSRLYRNLVVAVSLVSVTSIAAALILWHWLPLLGFVSLVPLVRLYLHWDARTVLRWRTTILEMLHARELDRDLLRTTLMKFKHLPQRSLGAMLMTLDVAGVNESTRPC